MTIFFKHFFSKNAYKQTMIYFKFVNLHPPVLQKKSFDGISFL